MWVNRSVTWIESTRDKAILKRIYLDHYFRVLCKGGSRTGAPGAHPPDCFQHTMFTISILFTILTTKTYGKCEGASKQSILLRRDPPPSSGFKFHPLHRQKNVELNLSYIFLSISSNKGIC